jgi:GNAT superfamily N-acetyltransferase
VTLDAAELAALVSAALPEEGLTAADLETCCFGPDTEILGERSAAAALNVGRVGDTAVAWLLLLAVHPDRQRKHRGRILLDATANRAREHGAVELHLGNAFPRYVWPGVDFRFTAALALFEAAGFEPGDTAFNMAIATRFRADPPVGVTIEREASGAAVELASRDYPHWVDETGRAVARGTCFAARADGETLGFACHSVTRAGWIGPMATRPRRQHGGVGRALLGAVCADLEENGHAEADIAWVGPLGFYAKCGARVSRVFRTAKLTL